jgi:hypothetical protein
MTLFGLHLARSRAGRDDTEEFNRNSAGINPIGWPDIFVAFYRGQVTIEQLVQAEPGTVEILRRAHGCYVSFYVGDRLLIEHDLPGAKNLLREATRTCSPQNLEYYVAEVELKRISN